MKEQNKTKIAAKTRGRCVNDTFSHKGFYPTNSTKKSLYKKYAVTV